MAEDVKDRIYKFILENKDSQFNVKQLSELLGISYPTTLKWIEVLRAEGLIQVFDFGNTKIVRAKHGDS